MAERSGTGCGCGRRGFLRAGIGAAVLLPLVGRGAPAPAGKAVGAMIPAPVGGSSEPSAIPWLDKNGSHNQSPGPGMEPSSIFHFKGRIARANAFTGMGTDGQGNRLAFGAVSTDFSFMDGTYWPTDRIERRGTFSHL